MMSTANNNQHHSIRVLQISDSHLGPSDQETILGMDTGQSFRDVLALIQAKEPPFDLIACTGDISNNGEFKAYQHFLATLQSRLPGKADFNWLPGNHDIQSRMNLALGVKSVRKEVRIGKWLFIFLNSVVPGQAYGQLSSKELEYLEATLQANRESHVLLFVHHHAFSVGSAWIDQQVIRNHERFFHLLGQHKNVRALVCGHIHQEYQARHQQIELLATPSTCYQFKPGSNEFALDTIMPGYRWFELQADGRFQTGVERIPPKNYHLHLDSKGY